MEKLSEKYKFNLSFEGGEAETLVLDSKIHKKEIIIKDFEKIWDNKTNSGYVEIKNYVLKNK